jgi:hypothetical protein
MTDNLKVWVENGKIAVEFLLPSGEKMRKDFPHGPLFCAQNAVVVGKWIFTTYDTHYFAPPEIRKVQEIGNELHIYTAEGIKILDIRTGELIRQIMK